MGFKTDTSFLQKLTMGATATRAAMNFLSEMSFQMIELERYCTSNKIWMTKVKRLRLADLVCVRTGLRVEVRGKSALQIRMSDSPSNPGRRWDSGLRDDDLVALVTCEDDAQVVVHGEPVFFAVGDLRSTAHLSRLGSRKSASEGAERDRTWPSIVPSDDGEVVDVGPDLIRARMRSGRLQSYRLNGKTPYVRPGAKFVGRASFLASIVPRMINPTVLLKRTWNPRDALQLPDATDRYVAAKALAHRRDEPVDDTRRLLEAALESEAEPRTALEMAGALARLGAERGYDFVASITRRIGETSPAYLRMEAVLILSELRDERAAGILDDVASNPEFAGDEIRQAAVWGLGKNGVEAYERLAKFVTDEEDDVALHAIAAFGANTPPPVIDKLAELLTTSPSARSCAAVSQALTLIGSHAVAQRLVQMAESGATPWVIATLGRLPRSVLAQVPLPDALARMVEPILLSTAESWLEQPATATAFQFLMQQKFSTFGDGCPTALGRGSNSR